MKKCGIVKKITLAFVLNVKKFCYEFPDGNYYWRFFIYGMSDKKYTLYIQNPADTSKITFDDWDEMLDFIEEEEERLLAGGFVKE